MTFNAQSRKFGSVSTRNFGRREVYGALVCPALCKEMMRGRFAVLNASGFGTQFVYADLDDMCDICK